MFFAFFSLSLSPLSSLIEMLDPLFFFCISLVSFHYVGVLWSGDLSPFEKHIYLAAVARFLVNADTSDILLQ